MPSNMFDKVCLRFGNPSPVMDWTVKSAVLKKIKINAKQYKTGAPNKGRKELVLSLLTIFKNTVRPRLERRLSKFSAEAE